VIDVRQARYFLAVADELHFGRAAQRLHMSQPPLSQAILQLERQLGARLLDRNARKVTLTETGRAFAHECRKLLASAERAAEVAQQAEAGMLGTLRLGVVTSALGEPLLSTLTAFRAARPRVELRVVEVDTPAGQQALLRHELDVAVIRLSAPTRTLHVQPWRRDHFVIALPPAHPLAADGDQPVDLAQLAEEQWVWLHRDASPDYHDQLIATCHQAGFTPDTRHHANSITTQLAMVACGLGVTLVPHVAASAVQPPTALRSLKRRADLVELALVSRADGHEPLVAEFVHTALERVEADVSQ
jgi:DNA-binding transcriptional LysR family regulator